MCNTQNDPNTSEREERRSGNKRLYFSRTPFSFSLIFGFYILKKMVKRKVVKNKTLDESFKIFSMLDTWANIDAKQEIKIDR